MMKFGQFNIRLILLLVVAAFCLVVFAADGYAQEDKKTRDVFGFDVDDEEAAVRSSTDDESAEGDGAGVTEKKRNLPEPLTTYMGRDIAQTMHYLGAEWLIRNEREREERCSLMLANLGIKRGITICDMGCGNGFYAIPMAKITGKEGQVLAVDVQPEMLKMLRDRAEEAEVDNVTPILGSFHDPRLPKQSVDLILMVDVYHEFSYPEQMLKGMHDALKPGGLIALLEYREEDPKVPIKPKHKMSKKQIMKEYEANGFKLVKEFDKLPWQHMMFFGKADEPNEGEEQAVKKESVTE